MQRHVKIQFVVISGGVQLCGIIIVRASIVNVAAFHRRRRGD